MAKRSRKKHQINGVAALILAVSIVLIGVGAIMAVNSCSPTDEPDTPLANGGNSDSGNTDPSQDPSTPGNGSDNPEVKHYPALETVSLPDNLSSQIKEYIGFTISFNKDNKTPNYVAWELLGEETSGDQQRTDNFWTDVEIEGCPTTKDYTRSGYDRGHMCPAADQKWSAQAMSDCFVMANICPQVHDLNAGAWNTLENKERQWAKRDSALMIIAGPLYDTSDTKTIGNANVRVPGAFFKVLLAPYVDQPRGIAFVYPNMSSPGNMQDYAMSIDELEKILNYDFFPALPDDIENKVESVFSFKEWNNSK